MDIYRKKSIWKIYLAFGGTLILVVAMLYTYYLASQLKEGERNKVELFVKAQESLNKDVLENPDLDVTFPFEVVESNRTIPVIEVDELGNITDYANFPEGKSTADLKKELEKLKRTGVVPIVSKGPGYEHFIYYKPSRLLVLITYFPLVMLLLLIAFMGFGYMGFSASRKAEQNQVWVGMAKETAHQLGTPISAIIAWIEHLKQLSDGELKKSDILKELDNDVYRLELIADRFSKIGSAPNLEKVDIIMELALSKQYMERRASRNVVFEFPKPNHEPKFVYVNSHLFSWVIENMLRNSLDAMDGKGTITLDVNDDENFVYIDISDTGKGIPNTKFKAVFQPGFTTKKRGWGLGLSLAKRIIENYHKGKIYVKKSEYNIGSTFTIKLPKNIA